MARPAKADAQKTRQNILESAYVLFSKKGQLASIRDIAGQSKVSLATILHYYKSKDGLYLACVENMYKDLASLKMEILKRVNLSLDKKSVLREVVEISYEFALSHKLALSLMLRTLLEESPEISKERAKQMEPLLRDGSKLMTAFCDLSEAQCRLAITSINHLIVRYSLTGEDELFEVTGADNREEAHSIILGHIVESAEKLLF